MDVLANNIKKYSLKNLLFHKFPNKNDNRKKYKFLKSVLILLFEKHHIIIYKK